MVKKILYIFPLLALFASCNAKPVPAKSENDEAPQRSNPSAIKMISIPSMLTSPEERAEYLVLNYWANFDFTDTTYVDCEEITEQAFVDYIDVLPHTKPEIAAKSIKGTIEKASADKKMLAYFFALYERYLYDPNSPMRNEEFFIPALEAMVSSPALDDVEKVRPQSLLRLALKNRTGEKAGDFSFTLKNGQQQKLHDQRADYLLLYFYNPGCQACITASEKMKASPVFSSLLDNKKLKIVAVYPDEDLTEWEKHIGDIPAGWINSYDREVYIKNEEVYDLKAIPTIYLLDKNKKVLFKDAYVEQIEAFLSEVN